MAVSFIIFLCGFFYKNLMYISLWSALIFSVLSCLIIGLYINEKITNQNFNEIENLKKEKEQLNRLHYVLHLINPAFTLDKKISVSLKILLEFIPEATFVCYSYQNSELKLLAASKTDSTLQPVDISSDNPLIEEIYLKIKAITDYESLNQTGGLDKPIIISNGRNIQGQISTIDLFSEVMGILVVTGKNNFNDFENRLIKEFCQSLALIFNDEKIYKENKESEDIQTFENNTSDLQLFGESLFNTMFPESLPDISGWKLAKYFVPSNNRSDFMDILSLTTDKQIVILGKCSGRGINAALYVSKLKLIIRCFIEEFQSPAKLLNKISRYLNSELMPDIFVDVTALTFSSQENQITVAMAGNTFPIINRTRSGFAEIPELETGIPLGLFNQGPEPYKDQYINLMPGDGVLLHTDGITDFPGKGLERVNNEDIKNFLDKIPEQNADDMLSNLVKLIKEQNLGELPDEDHSLIYLKAE